MEGKKMKDLINHWMRNNLSLVSKHPIPPDQQEVDN